MFTDAEVGKIRTVWAGRPTLVGEPDAEKDSNSWPSWESVFLSLDRFQEASRGSSTAVVGRKGSGKSACRIAAERSSGKGNDDRGSFVIGTSAEHLFDSAINDFQIRHAVGAAAVSVWYKVFAAEILKGIAKRLGGRPLVGEAEVAIRQWAIAEGFATADYGERLIAGARQLFPEIRERTADPTKKQLLRDEHVEKLLRSSRCTLFVDDFDNTGSSMGTARLGTKTVQAAIEAADLLSANFEGPNVSLLIREDLWLRCRIGWHYLDKVSNPLWLLWSAQELKSFLRLRLAAAASQALDESPGSRASEPFEVLWGLFFPADVMLENGASSQGFTYVLRRTMYTPRDLQTFLRLAMTGTRRLPLKAQDIYDAEAKFSTERMQYLINEFGDMCHGLSQCLHSFAGHSLEWRTSEMRAHLRGQMGQGAVAPTEAACTDPRSQEDFMRFLFRIGFLEVRLPKNPSQRDGPYEVRDGLRHPDHWAGARVDDSVRWAVRSTFYQALQVYRAEIGSGRRQ